MLPSIRAHSGQPSSSLKRFLSIPLRAICYETVMASTVIGFGEGLIL